MGDEQGQPENASFTLMLVVIVVLGIGFLALIAAEIILTFRGTHTMPAELNTLTSLIAGGLIGFVTPHVIKATKPNSAGSAG